VFHKKYVRLPATVKRQPKRKPQPKRIPFSSPSGGSTDYRARLTMSLSGRAYAVAARHERRIAQRAHGASRGGFTGRSKRWLDRAHSSR